MSVRTVLVLVLLGQLTTLWLQCHAHSEAHPPGTRAHIHLHLDWFHDQDDEDHDAAEHTDDAILSLPDEHTGPMATMLFFLDAGCVVFLPPQERVGVVSHPVERSSLPPTIPRRLRF